jgi:hypothetical protein
MQASRTVNTRPAWRTRMVSPSPIDSTMAEMRRPATPAGHAKATTSPTAAQPARPRTKPLAIAEVCLGKG